MQKTGYFLPPLIAIALASCATAPSATLTEAHNDYNNALAQTGIMSLAGTEMQQAGNLLNRADAAADMGADDDTEQLAYLSKQQTAIAREAAKQKTAETEIAYAAAKYNQIRYLENATEAESAKQQLTRLNAHETGRGPTITLNAASLCDSAYIKKLAEFLKHYPQLKVSIEGHADSSGKRHVNQGVSERRSYAVRMALIEQGIDGGRISTRGLADAFPLAGNGTAAGRRLNRRVEIIISDANGNIYSRIN